jgi:hypothetical protein
MRLLRRDRFISYFFPASALFCMPSLAAADGGTVRLSEQKGKYSISVLTAPTPVRVGTVDISVLVQEAATGELAPEVQVIINAVRRGSPGVALHHPATAGAATNKLYYAATFDLPEPGWYSVEVSIDGALGKAHVRFDLEAAEPPPRWLTMWPWVGWPVLAIMLFSIHQLLVRWRCRYTTKEGAPRGGHTRQKRQPH